MGQAEVIGTVDPSRLFEALQACYALRGVELEAVEGSTEASREAYRRLRAQKRRGENGNEKSSA